MRGSMTAPASAIRFAGISEVFVRNLDEVKTCGTSRGVDPLARSNKAPDPESFPPLAQTLRPLNASGLQKAGRRPLRSRFRLVPHVSKETAIHIVGIAATVKTRKKGPLTLPAPAHVSERRMVNVRRGEANRFRYAHRSVGS